MPARLPIWPVRNTCDVWGLSLLLVGRPWGAGDHVTRPGSRSWSQQGWSLESPEGRERLSVDLELLVELRRTTGMSAAGICSC